MNVRTGQFGPPPVLSARARIVPVAATMAGSMVSGLPVILDQPLLPPAGLMMLLAWRLLRPGLWPVWAALPLGLFDDLASGQPVGSAMLSWTLIFLAIEASERTLVWRDYVQDWLIAALCLIGGIVFGYVAALAAGGAAPFAVIVPQMLMAVLLFPMTARLCARLDQWRLR
ncbi:rod shape-determining protein MreD [Sphingomonas changnyeongensis]|uniref:Rod shape-determining protein MreD n=1 Tax=Sphingomonas changnyeongensis TaxID=2698679 RepID=A0A7Z2SA82_9SPHN|nr:rod shape-determining protein MreD [Sphingomonas changnyeongensis]QHL91574.1 rod shape-determining protein MreD [Sphingomonas changnyeongensis]